jgi:quinol monooxygenase YgiN
MEDKTVSAVGFARAKPDRAAQLGEILVRLAERSRSEEGFINCFVHTDVAEPNLFVFYEIWRSDEDVTRHLVQPYMKEFLKNRMEYLDQDLEVHQLTLRGPNPKAPEPADPAAMNELYVRAMNERNIDALMALYAKKSSAVWSPGKVVSANEHRQSVIEFMKKEPRLSAQVRESYIVEDLASLLVDWIVDVSGAPEMSGSGLGIDVLQRNGEGQWRYVITNPFANVK